MFRCVVVLSLAAVGVAQDLREDWVEKDLEVVARVRRAWDETDAAAFSATLGGSDVREDRDVGFGGRRRFFAVYGGYTTAWVRTLVVAGKVAAVGVHFDVGGREHAPAIRERLRAAWSGPAWSDVEGLRVRREDVALLTRHAARIRTRLGAPAAADTPLAPPPGLQRALSTLLDPLADLDFGTLCYEAGEPPPGRTETEDLVAAERFDLVRRVLRSPNAEARVYAADALLRSGIELSDADRAAIETIRGLRVGISCCDGCLVSEKRAAEILPQARR